MTDAPTSTSRVQKLREARREAGLVRIELYVPRDRKTEVRAKVAEILQRNDAPGHRCAGLAETDER